VGQSRFTGQSFFLLTFPWFMLGYAALAGMWGWREGSVGFAIVYAGSGWLCAATLPWRFDVCDDGLELRFAFGKHRFLTKANVTVRCRVGSPVALVGRSRRVGYPLTPGLREQNRKMLRSVLIDTGYEVS
jgi:hypothetical protein